MHLKPERLMACLVIAALYSQAGFAQCKVSGVVLAEGAPLSGAKISVHNNARLLVSATTLADGRFNLNYAEPARTAPTVIVSVVANGYAKEGRNLLRNPTQICPHAADLGFALVAGDNLNSTSLAPTFTIYVSPFELYGVDDAHQAEKFNSDLPQFIFHKIMAYKSSLALEAKVGDMSISAIEQKLSSNEVAQIRKLGHQLGALAMVVGEVEILSGHKTGIELLSIVKPIPVFENLEINSIAITDLLPAGALRPSKVGRQLSDYWGKQALIAYVLQSLAMHQGEWQKTELDNMEQILISVRSTMRDEADPFKAMVDKLLNVVKDKR